MQAAVRGRYWLRLVTLFCLFASVLASAHAGSNNRFDDIVARGVLRVGTTGDYKPFSYRTGKNGEFIGIDIEMAGALAQELGVKLQIVPTSWPTLMKDFGEDQFDIALGGVSITPERQKKGLFSVAYLRDGKTPITRCENQARFQTLAQINQTGVRLIVNPGGTNERFAKARAPLAQLIVYPDNVTIFDQLVANAADLMMTDAIETRLQQRLHPQLCAVHPEQPFDVSEKAILLPQDTAFKAVIDKWLQQRISSGVLQKSVDRWLDFPWGLEPLRSAIDQRLLLAHAVARAKWNVQAPIEDKPREAQVIQAAVQQGAALGLPEAWVETVFRAQIEASKTVQRELYANWKAQQAGKFDDAPDLAKTIRPELDRITAQLLHSLVDNQTVLKDTARKADVARAMQPLEATALSPAAVEQALAPFTR
jgi:chorismate mutase-like protein